MDQPKIERMLRLMKVMAGNTNHNVAELGRMLGMSYRTVYRYIDTFKSAGFAVEKLYGNVYKLGKMPKTSPDFENLLYFTQEEAYVVNNLIDGLEETTEFKTTLKKKLAAIYDSTSVAEFSDNKSNGTKIQKLSEAYNNKRQVVLHNYESGNSHSIRDRFVEPFGFTRNCTEIIALDLEDGHNKFFRVSRVKEVEILPQKWTAERSHRRPAMDVFHMGGMNASKVKMQLDVLAKNLLLEEFPMAEKDLRRDGNKWYLETNVYKYDGACRFYCGLMDHIKIVDSPEFEAFVDEFIQQNRR